MLDVRLLGLPNESIVQGFPGIPATWPRIMATIQIRPPVRERERTPLPIRQVTVGLYRTDVVHIPSSRPSMSSNKREQSFLVTKLKSLWPGPTSGSSGPSTAKSSPGYGLDLPFTLTLPTSRAISGSIALGKVAETTYHLFVNITIDNGSDPEVPEHHRFPVQIRRFDTLSTFATMQSPLRGEQMAIDHLTALEWSLPVRCYGPRDVLQVTLNIAPNLDWKKARKVKVKRFSAEIVQILKFTPPDDGGDPDSSVAAWAGKEKRQRVCKVAEDAADFEKVLEMEIPAAPLENSDHITAKDRADVPAEGRTGFTTACALFSIEFVLVLKARLVHAKDVEIEVPITLSQFDHAQSMVFMTSVHEAANLARFADRKSQPPKAYPRPIDAVVHVM